MDLEVTKGDEVIALGLPLAAVSAGRPRGTLVDTDVLLLAERIGSNGATDFVRWGRHCDFERLAGVEVLAYDVPGNA